MYIEHKAKKLAKFILISGKINYDQSNPFRLFSLSFKLLIMAAAAAVAMAVVVFIIAAFFTYGTYFIKPAIRLFSCSCMLKMLNTLFRNVLLRTQIRMGSRNGGENRMGHQSSEKKITICLVRIDGRDLLFSEQLIKFSFTYNFVATLTADLNKCVSFKWKCLPNPQSSKSI